MTRDSMFIYGMKHAMLMLQLVVLPAACHFLTCLCLHAKLLWMKSLAQMMQTCFQLAVLRNLKLLGWGEGGGAAWLRCCKQYDLHMI